jgi:tetratricopeptide (TPR) repeat protein
MKFTTLIVPAIVALSLNAQEDLAPKLARAQGTGLEQLRDLQARLAAANATPEQKAYHEAFLTYCIVNQTSQKEPKQAEANLDRIIKVLETRKDAESMALLGGCIGVKLGFSPMSGMFLAPKALGLFEEAAKLSPNNPRVLVLQGVHILHTPSFFGGGAEKALPILESAVKAAEAETTPKDPWAPRWGKVESYGWLAMAQAEKGMFPEAEANIAKAKAIDPTHGFILHFTEKRVQDLKNKKK